MSRVGWAVLIALWIVTILWARSAEAQSRIDWAGGQSFVEIVPMTGGDAVAEVRFKNASVHATAIETFDLSVAGFSVSITAEVGHGNVPDTITIEPPEGFVAIPRSLTVAEGDSAAAVIVPIIAEMM